MRGRHAPDLSGEGKEWAERMGYHWAQNTDPSLAFAGFMYRKTIMTAVKPMKVRYAFAEDKIIEDEFPDEVEIVRALPLPPNVFREIWLRSQNERAYRRFLILPGTTAEIQENTKEGYRNPRYREAYWKKAPYRADFSLTGVSIPMIAPDDAPSVRAGRRRASRKTP
ncbi:MAG TPA: hypothetical protein VHN82_08950 [Methanoregula sp.]|nr:hypothetical protein [Methanoregula sp.]